MNRFIFRHDKPVGERLVGFQQVFYVETQPSFIKANIKQQTHPKSGTVWQRNEYRYKIDVPAHEPLLDALTYLPMYPFVYFEHEISGKARCTEITFNVVWKNYLAKIEIEFCVDSVISGTCEIPMPISGKSERPNWNKSISFDEIVLSSSTHYTAPWDENVPSGFVGIIYDSVDNGNLINPALRQLTNLQRWKVLQLEKDALYMSLIDGSWVFDGDKMQPLAKIDSIEVVGLNHYLTGTNYSGMFMSAEYSLDSGATWWATYSATVTNGAFSIPISLIASGTMYRIRLWVHGAVYGYTDTYLIP